MVRKFMIFCVCVCCILVVFGHSAENFTYDSVKSTLENIAADSDLVVNDFNTMSILSYYWKDRMQIDYSAGERIGLAIGNGTGTGNVPTNTVIYWYYLLDVNTNEVIEYYRYEVFEYGSAEDARFAYDLFENIFNYSAVVDWTSPDNILQNIALGVVTIVQFIGLIGAAIFTLFYFIFDIFEVVFGLIWGMLHILGF